MRFIFALICGLLFTHSTLAQVGARVKTPHAEVSLIAQNASVAPGSDTWVGLRIQHIPHWHTYWRNPGESGLPTSLEWKLPMGVRVGEIAWPTPKRLPTGPLINYGYEDDLLLPMKVSVPTGVATPVTLEAKATWLICKDVCIPEEGVVSLTLPIASNAAPNAAASADAALFEKAFAAQPSPLPAAAVTLSTAQRSASEIALAIANVPMQTTRTAYFYPYAEGLIEPSAPQSAFANSDQLAVKMKLAANAVASPTLDGVLAVGDRAYEVKLTVATVASVAIPAGLVALPNSSLPAAQKAALSSEKISVETMTGSGADLGLLTAFALAFVGGMILNLMPCVFPVLSIKILGFAQQAGSNKAAMRTHGVAYSCGVIASFLLLAALLLAVRAAGSNVGWGFQLQHPAVIAVLAVIFFLIGLNLLGVFELRFAPNVAQGEAKHPVVNAFLSGVLAVVAASPCTAPFMGAALGFAMTQSAATSLAIFAALGIGMALPYALLSWFPGWLKKLPRPGAWMITLKKWLSLPMFATVAWLGWVFWMQVSPQAAVAATQVADDKWQKWDDAAIAASLAQGKPVFVDFTAAWCVSCQANKKLVLNTESVGKAFAAKKVTLMRADWTKQDPTITEALKALGRSGVPVYVLHRPGKAPLVLPEILTAGIIDDALNTL